MAKVKGLFQRGGYWWARKDVPKPLQGIVGKTSLQNTLDTSDIKIALVRFPAVMTEFERTITDARDKLAGKPDSVESIREALRNIVIHVPPNPFADLTPKVALGTIFDEWKRAKEPRPNTVTEYRRAMELFIAMNGDLSITR